MNNNKPAVPTAVVAVSVLVIPWLALSVLWTPFSWLFPVAVVAMILTSDNGLIVNRRAGRKRYRELMGPDAPIKSRWRS